jgi:HPt (histidine-containing phosphotransfer) domain-containing protein
MNRTTNLSYLKSISDNDENFMSDMITTFLEQTPELLAEMQLLARQNNWPQIGRTAHRMKPSLTFMGMNDGQRLIKDIEQYCQNKSNAEQLFKLINMLSRECEMAFNELRKKNIA